MIKTLFNEFKSSIKSPDTEEKLDLILYRPLGFIIAKISRVLRLTPTMLSIFGLISGFVAAYYFLHPFSKSALILASIYFVLSGIFDSADGQLARIANQSTKLGLILDGICDSIVTIAVYIACSMPLLMKYGTGFTIIIFLALYMHSIQCAILDFYHREYLFFGYGKTENDTYWNPSIMDGINIINESKSRVEKVMNSMRLSWIKKQQMLSTRPDEKRQAMKQYLLTCTTEQKEVFTKTYRKHNLRLLPFWRLLGPNAHTFMIILFMFLGRFDLYIFVFDLIFFNITIALVGILQKKSDATFFSEINLFENAK